MDTTSSSTNQMNSVENTTESTSSRPSRNRQRTEFLGASTSETDTKENEKEEPAAKTRKRRQAAAPPAPAKKPAKRNTQQVSCCTEDVDLQFGSSNRFCQNGCTILVGDTYRMNKYKTAFCTACFAKRMETNRQMVATAWKELENLNKRTEKIVECALCKSKIHQCCSLNVSGGPVACLPCSREQRRLTLKDYRRNKFDKYMEDYLNEFLRKKTGSQDLANPISVASYRTATSKPMDQIAPFFYKKDFTNKYGTNIDYETRNMYIFQRIDDVDVLVFIMSCQEYQNLLNQNWAVIDFLDSVAYVEPEELRGRLFGEAIIAYFAYVKSIGFNSIHFFSDPPKHKDDDYFFNIHPTFHSYLTVDGLLRWYNRVLEKGKKDKVIEVIRTCEEYYKLHPYSTTTDLVPFDGGLWMRCLNEAQGVVRTLPTKIGTKRYVSEFERLISEKLESNALNNFFLELNKRSTTVNDPDRLNPHKILSNRDDFLELCRDRNWEFSSLRRAKYASVGVIALIFGDI